MHLNAYASTTVSTLDVSMGAVKEKFQQANTVTSTGSLPAKHCSVFGHMWNNQNPALGVSHPICRPQAETQYNHSKLLHQQCLHCTLYWHT